VSLSSNRATAYLVSNAFVNLTSFKHLLTKKLDSIKVVVKWRKYEINRKATWINPTDHLCQLASKLVHSFSKYPVHKFGKRRVNGCRDGWRTECLCLPVWPGTGINMLVFTTNIQIVWHFTTGMCHSVDVPTCTRSSTVTETARHFVPLNISLCRSRSLKLRSFKMTPLSKAYVSLY